MSLFCDYIMSNYSVYLRSVISHVTYHKYLNQISYSKGYIKLAQSRLATRVPLSSVGCLNLYQIYNL